MRAEEEAGRARDQLTTPQTDIIVAVDMVQKVDGALSNITGDVGEVNCTPALLSSASFPDLVAETLERWNVPPSALQLELTEHESLHAFDRVAAAASRMALRGLRIVVDDFGRGTTSFERLLDLPLAELKVDKSIFWQCIDQAISINAAISAGGPEIRDPFRQLRKIVFRQDWPEAAQRLGPSRGCAITGH